MIKHVCFVLSLVSIKWCRRPQDYFPDKADGYYRWHIYQTVTGAAFLNFLLNAMDDIREYLHQTFSRRWTWRRAPVLRPDLNSLDFFVCGYLKTLVNSTPVNSFKNLPLWINQKCRQIQANEGVLESVLTYFRIRCHVCLEMEGETVLFHERDFNGDRDKRNSRAFPINWVFILEIRL